MMKRMRALTAALAIAMLGFGMALAQSGDALSSGHIAEAVVFQGKLFLRGALESPQTGALVSIDLATGARTTYFDRGVIDIDMTDGNLWVLRQSTEEARNFTILNWVDTNFAIFVTTGAGVPQPLAMIAAPRKIVLLTPVSVHTFDTSLKRWAGVKLRGGLRYAPTFTVAMPKHDNVLYFGANPIPGAPSPGGAARSGDNGEALDVLQRIDIGNGSITGIQQRSGTNPCDGPLTTACSRVTAMVPDSANGSCVIAAVGMVDREISDGRVLRVCRNDVTVVFEQKSAQQPAGVPIVNTEPIWSLAATSDGFWAASRSAIYRFKGDAHTDIPLPTAAPYGGTPMGRGQGAVVVPTSVTSAQSASGFTTLVAGAE